jgi:hypothetical protein
METGQSYEGNSMRQNRFAFVSFVLLAVAAACAAGQVARSAPDGAAATSNRVFEIRTYSTEPGRLDALLARFREHTTKLFEKHGMTNIGYWTPADEPRSNDTLIYVIAHASRAAAKQNWEAFGSDPEWASVRDESEKDGKIVTKVESEFANPTDFSPLR